MSYVFNLNAPDHASTDVQGGQELSLEWECETDVIAVSAQVIAALALQEGVFKGASHPDYAYAQCTNITADRDPQAPYRFTVRALFKEPPPQPGSELNPTGGQPSPPERPPFVEGEFRREDHFPQLDRGGRPFTNSAGDPFDSPPAVPRCIGQIQITRYFDSISYFTLKQYENCCNSEEWNGFPPHSLLIEAVRWRPVTIRGWYGWSVQFTLAHKDKTPEQGLIDLAEWVDELEGGVITGGWFPTPVLDVGWYYLNGGRLPYDDPPGSSVPKPVPGLLNGIDGNRSDDPKCVGFDLYARISFAIFD